MAHRTKSELNRMLEFGKVAACWYLISQSKMTTREAGKLLGIGNSTAARMSGSFEAIYRTQVERPETVVESTLEPLPIDAPQSERIEWHERSLSQLIAKYTATYDPRLSESIQKLASAYAMILRAAREEKKELAGENALQVKYGKAFDFSDCDNETDNLAELAGQLEEAPTEGESDPEKVAE